MGSELAMADFEMDIDVSGQHEEQVDEDLIDYESDNHEQLDTFEPHERDEPIEATMHTLEASEAVMIAEISTPLESQSQIGSEKLGSVMEDVDNAEASIDDSMHDGTDNQQHGFEEQDQDDVDVDLGDHPEHAVQLDEATEPVFESQIDAPQEDDGYHEINYDHGGEVGPVIDTQTNEHIQTPVQESSLEHEDQDSSQNGEEEHEALNDEDANSKTAHECREEEPGAVENDTSEFAEHVNLEGETSTQIQDHDVVDDDTSEAAAFDLHETENVASHNVEPQPHMAESKLVAVTDDVGAVDDGSRVASREGSREGHHLEADDGEGEHVEDGSLNDDEGSDHPRSEATHDQNDDSDVNMPHIIVTYKGDEYPCFSSTSGGFFTELSVLDASMEELMAGFRNELAGELAVDDELVFQIEELGLEINESHAQDCLPGVTLNQVLEIFDLLVQNQDPDSTRTLRTHLLTKPNISKRYEFLVESAAAGKGLDEVMYLFEAVTPNANSSIDTPSGVDPTEHDSDAEQDDVYQEEQLQEFETFDAAGSNTTNEGTDHVAGDTTGAESVPNAAEDGEQEETDQDQHLPSQQGEGEGEGEEESSNHSTSAEKGPGTEHDEAGDAGDAAHYADHNELERDSSPYLGLNFEDGADASEEIGLDVVADLDDDQLQKGTVATSSTTVTLDDDVEVEPNAGLDSNANGEVNTESAPGSGDEHAEIDWRDDIDNTSDVEDHTSTGGKRAHTEAELGSEEEQDAKRLRS